MYKLHALVDSADERSFAAVSQSLVAHGVRPIRMTDATKLGTIINNVKVSAVFLDWDSLRAAQSDAVREVRRSHSNRRVPIAVLTGSPSVSVLADAHREGANFFLSKPLEPTQLHRTVQSMLPVMQDERRGYQRVPLSMPVLCKWRGAERHTGEVVNISASGMLMSVWPQPDIGARLMLAFGMQEFEQEFVVPAEVVRQDGKDRVGVRYIWSSQHYYEQLKGMLEERSAPPLN